MIVPYLVIYGMLGPGGESMWVNPKTGKGWTDEEEAVFAEIQSVSRLSRIRSIQLWKRFEKDREKAIATAKREYRRPTAQELAGLAKGRATQKRLRTSLDHS